MGYINRHELNLINKVRMLWMQHGEWTRMAFSSIIFKNPDEEAVLKRLLKNPKDFAHLLKCFYGGVIAFKFEVLLAEHLSLAGDLVKASMAGDTALAEKLNERLYKNAEEISALLSSINPHWHYEEWQSMLFHHLDLAIAMATGMLEGEYKKSIRTYDEYEAQIMVMADMMVFGILRQFFQPRCR